MRKTTEKKIAPMAVTAVVLLLAAPLAVLAFIALVMVVRVSPGAALALLPFAVLGGAVAVGIVKALLQRLDEIDGGEEEAASRY